MTTEQENPTPDEGASIQDRLERYLAADDGEEPQQSAPQEDAEPQEPVETEDDAPDESDEPQLSTSELAKYLGVDEDMLDADENGDLFIKTKIDGQEGRAKFQDFVKSYQLQGHIDNQSREIAAQKQAFQNAIAEQQQAITQRMQYVEDMAGIAQQTLMNDYHGINWAQLSRDDPAEYVAKQHEFQQRSAQLNQVLQTVQMERQQAAQQQQQTFQQMLQHEAQRLTELIPDWKDAEKAKAERTELREWGKSIGLPQQDIDGVSNALYVQIMRKAMLYDKSQQSKTIMEKKVRTAPKLVKAGQPDTISRGDKTVRDLKTNIRKSGGKSGVVEYLLATGKA